MRKAAPFLLLAALAALTTPASAQLVNRRAPSFSLPDSAYKQYDILDYRGKWLLIYFMQTNPQLCPTCRQMSQKLDAIQKAHAGNTALLSIVITPPDNQTTVAKYVQEAKISGPILFDMSQVAIAYFKATPTNNSVSMPHLFAVNPQGTILREWSVAAMSQVNFQADLDALLSGGASKGKK